MALLGTGIRSSRQAAQLAATSRIRDAMHGINMVSRAREEAEDYRNLLADIASGLIALRDAGVAVPELNQQEATA